MNPFMRTEAHSLRTNAMELAMVSSGVHGVADRPNTVVYFDMRRHEQGLPPLAVDNYNARYDLLMFPALRVSAFVMRFVGYEMDMPKALCSE